MKNKTKVQEYFTAFVMLLPYIISFFMFFAYPLAKAFIISFQEFSFLGDIPPKFVGLLNYKEALTNKMFLDSIVNTFYYSILVVPTQLIIALILAVIVNDKVKFKDFFRTTYYLPTVTSPVAVSIIFLFLYKTDGLVNQILSHIGITPRNWFNEPSFVMPAIVSVAVWGSVGFYMVTFLSGLSTIPDQLYEAAEVEGAGEFTKLIKITIPLLKPMIFFNTVVSFISTLQMFDLSYIIGGSDGGPMGKAMTMVVMIYRTAFKEFNMGVASAMAFIVFGIIFILTLIQRKFFGEEMSY
ncbi:carbohydrate ABC transporter permease [Caldicellulosiruptor sp. DIB 104C]|uniref:carbohydrate ABC transporter permease n=1 Tax=Caldicellulosiruptor sp. DIB 104C TaxID=3019889 RepID=UPI0023054FCD|nr:sugar ABC transporter permease [Caldicellulosiruptor sp. DIB 104C]